MEVPFFVLMGIAHLVMFVSMAIAFAAFIDSEEDAFKSAGCTFLVALVVVAATWGIVNWHISYDYKDKVETYVSATVGGVDVIVEGGKILNLNDHFDRDVEEGTVIEKTYWDKDYGWFEGLSCPTYEIKATE
jgi:hypothetical protein